MSPRYTVTLTVEERSELEALTRREKTPARTFIHARALLLCDTSSGVAWKVADVAAALGVTSRTIEHVKERFVESGLDAAVDRKQTAKPLRDIKFDAVFEGRLKELAASAPPEGNTRWTVRLIAEKVVELKITESISHMTVQRILKKHGIKI